MTAGAALGQGFGADDNEGPYRIGPFADAEAAERVASLLDHSQVAVPGEGEQRGASLGFIVTTAVLDKPTARQAQADLAALGFTDTWYVPNGPWAQRVSVGVFAKRDLAKARSDEVRALGVETHVSARYAASEYWLDVRSPYLEPDLVAQIESHLSPSARLVELHNIPR